jgi:hypothetical protein
MPESHDIATANRQGLLRKLSGTATDVLLGTGVFGGFSLDNLSDVTITTPATGSALIYNGAAWVDGQIDLADGDAVTGDLPFANLAQGSALSVLGVTGNSTADNASIAAGSDHQVLRRSGSAVAFGAVVLSQSAAVTGDLAFANLAQGAALSVLGVTGNSTADNASIAAASDHQVLRRSGTAVAFGSVNLAQSAAVTGTLPVGNGGTGTATPAGTYTPTVTGVANTDSVASYQCQYMQVGATVTVSGLFDVNPTLTATLTEVGISLPVASDFGAGEDCAGVAFCSAVAGMGASIIADATNDRARVLFISSDVNDRTMSFTFTYQVI